MPESANKPDIACTLTDQEHKQRRALVRKTVIPHVLKAEKTASGLEFSFPNDARERVEEFVSLERQCCAFLSFNFASHEQGFILSIEGPEEARETLNMFAKGLGMN